MRDTRMQTHSAAVKMVDIDQVEVEQTTASTACHCQPNVAHTTADSADLRSNE